MVWRRITQICSGLFILLTTIVSGIALLMLVQGAKFLSVQTGSMVPAIHKGDLVIDTRVPVRQLAVGDVVTFMNPAHHGQTITHRLVAVPTGMNQHFVTKGDANPVADPPIIGSSIVGRVSWHVPYAGFGIDFARKPFGLILLVYVPALVVVGAEVKRLARYYKEAEPYVAAGYDPHPTVHSTPSTQWHKTAKTSSFLVIISIASISIAAPAHALLSSTTSLADNSFSTVASGGHLLIQQVVMADNTDEGKDCPEPDSIVGTSNTRSHVRVEDDSKSFENALNNNPQTTDSGDAVVNCNHADGRTITGAVDSNSKANFAIDNNHKKNKKLHSHDTPIQAVVIYNSTNTAINVARWKLIDYDGTHIISSGNRIIDAHDSFTFNWPVAHGLVRTGDHLVLKNKTGVIIDAISWGNDISQLNPAIAITTDTTRLTRKALALDTNTAADWQTSP